MGKDGAFSNDDGSLSNDNLNVFNNFCISLGHDPAQFLANDKYGVRVRLLFTYTLCTPYKIPRQNFKNYLPASYQQAGGYLYDTGLFDSAADDDPTIDSRYTGTIEISYRQAARGITKIYSIPVAIEIRSCPAYMKP